jgi:kynurenine formamidase
LTRLIDLSMPVTRDTVTFPRVPAPLLLMNETWTEFADRIGASAMGVTSLTATSLVVTNDHVGTHVDARLHVVPGAPGPEGIPLELCFSDAVVLDFRDRSFGYAITPTDIDAALERIDYTPKPRDIVLIHTGASAWNTEDRYRTDHCGMSGDATRHLIAMGVRMMGIDAITFDPPVWSMFESGRLWEAHRVMNDEAYWHVENLTNLDAIPTPHGFKVALFPILWVGTTGAPVRAVAILD